MATTNGTPSIPSAPATVAVLTLGCKLNQAESEAIARDLKQRGLRVIDRPVSAAAYIINTCSVTHVADRKSRHLVRLARRLSPDAVVVLTGCFPETAGVEAARATGADLVVPSRDKDTVVTALLERLSVAGPPADGAAPGLRTRAFVKAQEGCNDVCAFCIVPRTRGRERSIPVEQVVAAVAEREADGVQEVVITGTQLGAYGRDLDGLRYGPAGLIRALLAGTSIPRIRFSSLQPQDITPELLDLWEDPRLCRHFHLALQSGSDSVLRRMRRRYTIGRYRGALEHIRSRVSGAAITTDVIAGFPGETEQEANDSLAFCREAGFAMLHVFPYSRRPGTLAHLQGGHLPEQVKRERLSRLLALAEESAAAYRREALQRTAAVLWEDVKAGADGVPLWEGLTDTYVRVFARSTANLRNRILPAYLYAEASGGLWGQLDLPAPELGAQDHAIPLMVVGRR